MKYFFLIFTYTFLYSCTGKAQIDSIKTENKTNNILSDIENFQLEHQNKSNSISKGTVDNGSLINGCFLPFEGKNFRYFDKQSYLMSRCFMHCEIVDIIQNSMNKLEQTVPERTFILMEASNEHGDKISPHRTHQNGTSIDLMIPLKKDDKPYTILDSLGTSHYFLHFNNNAQYSEDTSISIDFEALAKEILAIIETSKKSNWKISKVILKVEYVSLLMNTKYAQELKNIYFAKKLEAIINDLHDDHIHIDFERKN